VCGIKRARIGSRKELQHIQAYRAEAGRINLIPWKSISYEVAADLMTRGSIVNTPRDRRGIAVVPGGYQVGKIA
jgi:hypothetical protein